MRHLIYFIGESVPAWWERETEGARVFAVCQPEPPGLSIGHYHNLAARRVATEWMMKLDVDSLPHVGYFRELVPLLETAAPRQWFNGGMFYLKRGIPLPTSVGIPVDVYARIMYARPVNAGTSCIFPAGSNFICRPADYIAAGGCDERFRGYGWEDYQQLYALESYWRGKDALPGTVDLRNVTQRCKEELSRFYARRLWTRNQWLCLLHYWHEPGRDPVYRSHIEANRKILLEWVTCTKANGSKPSSLPS